MKKLCRSGSGYNSDPYPFSVKRKNKKLMHFEVAPAPVLLKIKRGDSGAVIWV
jgi:hypothetical protein